MKKNYISKFVVQFLCAAFLLSVSFTLSAQNIAINTGGTAAGATNMFEVTQTSTAAYMVAIHAIHSAANAAADTGYAFKAVKTGATGNNVAGYFSAMGGAINSAIIVPRNRGFVGFGTVYPRSILHIENGEAKITAFDTDAAISATRPAWQFGAQGAGFTIRNTSDFAVFSEKVFIDYLGNVGIGTTVPSTLFHTNLSTQTTATVNSLLISRWTRPQTPGVKWGNAFDILLGSYGTSVNSQSRLDFKLANGGTDLPDVTVMTLQGDGSVGIGTTAPFRKLEISNMSDGITFGQVADNTQTIQTYIDGHWSDRTTYAGGCCNGLFLQPDVGYVAIGTAAPSGSYRLEINGKIKTTSVNESSDIRWKKDISTLDSALVKVTELRGVNYKWRTDEFKDKDFDNDTQIGLIAQEVEKVYPELVCTDKDGFKSVEYSKLVAVLIEAIKEQQAAIENHKSQADIFKSDINYLKASVELLLQQAAKK